MAGAAHSQQEAQGDSRPSLSLPDPEEEGPSSLQASVCPWSLWACLGQGLGSRAGHGGVTSCTPRRSLWLPCCYLRPTVSRVFLPSAALSDSCDPGNGAPALGPQDRKRGSPLPPAPLGPHPTGQSRLLHTEPWPSPGPPRASPAETPTSPSRRLFRTPRRSPLPGEAPYALRLSPAPVTPVWLLKVRGPAAESPSTWQAWGGGTQDVTKGQGMGEIWWSFDPGSPGTAWGLRVLGGAETWAGPSTGSG